MHENFIRAFVAIFNCIMWEKKATNSQMNSQRFAGAKNKVN